MIGSFKAVAALLLVAGLATAFVVPIPVAPEKSGKDLASLERRLHGTWKGGACIGELTLRADGTFERQHYSPGNNRLTGTWEVVWHALPPTLVFTCKTSDAPDRIKVGETQEFKLIQLDDETFAYDQGGHRVVYERVKK
jgi:hypothetical protein